MTTYMVGVQTLPQVDAQMQYQMPVELQPTQVLPAQVMPVQQGYQTVQAGGPATQTVAPQVTPININVNVSYPAPVQATQGQQTISAGGAAAAPAATPPVVQPLTPPPAPAVQQQSAAPAAPPVTGGGATDGVAAMNNAVAQLSGAVAQLTQAVAQLTQLVTTMAAGQPGTSGGGPGAGQSPSQTPATPGGQTPPSGQTPPNQGAPTQGSTRQKVLDLAKSQLGVKEEGGEDRGEKINEYRRSVVGDQGNSPAPWCAYFASWLFNQAGAPIVDNNGDGLVANVGDWGKKAGRWLGAGSSPQAADMILFKFNGGSNNWANHIGIVEKVENGKVYTIEGNSSDSVARRTYDLTDPRIVGYVTAE